MPPSFEPREVKGSTGPTVSIVIILLLVIAGAIYFWSVRNERSDSTLPYIPGDEATTTPLSGVQAR